MYKITTNRITIQENEDALIIGDVHGYYDALEKLISKIDLDTTKVFLVGDIIDRGPDSKKIYDLLINNDNFYAVKGNHELMLIRAYENGISGKTLNKEAFNWMFKLGGKNTLDSFNFEHWTDEGFKELIQNLEGLPEIIHLEVENDKDILISHSSLELKNEKQTLQEIVQQNDYIKLLTNRKIDKRTPIDWIINVFGHTPVLKENIEQKEGYLNVDTGFSHNKKDEDAYLTGYLHRKKEYIHIKL